MGFEFATPLVVGIQVFIFEWVGNHVIELQISYFLSVYVKCFYQLVLLRPNGSIN